MSVFWKLHIASPWGRMCNLTQILMREKQPRKKKFLLPLKFNIRQTRIPNNGVFRIVTTTGDESILQHSGTMFRV
jgi:hypothetical protein